MNPRDMSEDVLARRTAFYDACQAAIADEHLSAACSVYDVRFETDGIRLVSLSDAPIVLEAPRTEASGVVYRSKYIPSVVSVFRNAADAGKTAPIG